MPAGGLCHIAAALHVLFILLLGCIIIPIIANPHLAYLLTDSLGQFLTRTIIKAGLSNVRHDMNWESHQTPFGSKMMQATEWRPPPGPPRIAILTCGSRGDAQPVTALALRMKREGWIVKVLVNTPFDELARTFPLDVVGLHWMPLTGIPTNITEVVYSAVESFKPHLVLYRAGCIWLEAWALEKGTGVPTVEFNFQESSTLEARGLPDSELSWKRWQLPFQGTWAPTFLEQDDFVDRAGRGRPMLLAMSSEFLTRDAPYTLSATTGQHATGSWVLSTTDEDSGSGQRDNAHFGGTQQEELVEFLRDKPPPVCMSWGSMDAQPDSKKLGRLAVGALMESGRRGIITEGKAQLGPWTLEGASNEEELQTYAAENVLWIKGAPHEWLMPRCSSVVHHGGLGTTVATLRALRPSVITPVAYDQPHLAQHMAKKGVAVALSHPRELDASELAAAMRESEGKNVTQAAADMGRRLLEEDGTGRATEVLKQYMKAKQIIE